MYNVHRLQYGIKVAPTIFQGLMNTMLVDLDLATAYLEDIRIESKNRDHAKHVLEVLKKWKNLVLN